MNSHPAPEIGRGRFENSPFFSFAPVLPPSFPFLHVTYPVTQYLCGISISTQNALTNGLREAPLPRRKGIVVGEEAMARKAFLYCFPSQN